MMPRAIFGWSSFVVATLLAVVPASAQYSGYSIPDPATGEKYHVEARLGFWSPTPSVVFASESLGIAGDRIDAVADLGFAKKTLTDIHAVVRPSRKHKFLFDYLPIKYSVDTVVKRQFVFNGQRYEIGFPLQAAFDWKAYRLGYEYDFVYRDRWFIGLILDVQYTNVQIDLAAPLVSEYASAKAPVPTFGGIVRVYPAANISVTTEVTGVRLSGGAGDYKGHWLDFNIYGTVNFTHHAGVQFGYRSLDVGYTIKQDSGDLEFKGFYFAGVGRF